MIYALNLDSETDRILSATYDRYGTPSMPRVSYLPSGDISNYLYQNGEYVYDPLPTPEPPTPAPSVTQLRADVDYIAMMSDIDLDVEVS